MHLTLLMVSVEISDQYGTSKNLLVGIFDNEDSLNAAKARTEKFYSYRRISFEETKVKVNEEIELQRF